MPKNADQAFFDRADAHVHLSNDQLKEIKAGNVSASMMFATARFNAWLCASGFDSGPEMASVRDKNIEYFVDQYREMLKENMDEYISRFDVYMLGKKP